MLARYRRYFAVLGFLLLATPLLAGLVAPDSPDAILKEARQPAPPPAAPRTVEAALSFPHEADAYAKDHFGLRAKMIRLHKDLTKPLVLKDGLIAIRGISGRLYAIMGDMVAQSAGHVVRSQRLAETADVIAAVRDALRDRGVRFLVALPPNSSTIYPDDLPAWARNRGVKTEYDLFLEAMRERGVRAVDLRPALSRARLDGPVFLANDLHWNVRGAVAGFNAVVEEDGRPDWRIVPSSAIGPLVERKGGDIARILGVDDDARESTEAFILPARGGTEILPGGDRAMPDHMIVGSRPGPTVVVIGDSFTTSYFPVFLSQNVGRAIWIHHQFCGFDWSAIDRFHPDEVWWSPVERFLLCEPGRRPDGIRRTAAASN